MGLLSVDENKCKRDAICASECPMAIIKLKDGGGFPEMVPGGEQVCLVCGHCVAVCPHGALSHDKVPVEECPDIDKGLIIDERQDILYIPERVVTFSGDSTYVHLKAADADSLVAREVEIGFSDGLSVEILGGLGEGDMVVDQ